jgi:protoporphyrin/coproporphyrin ferrochelatase
MTSVVLLQMGGPSTLADLRHFYQRLFSDTRMIQLPSVVQPVQPGLAWLVAALRSRTMRARYQLIGGGSPLLTHTRALADSLGGELARRGQRADVHVAMRYSDPTAAQVAADLRRGGERDVVVLPLYPHWSAATTGSSVEDFSRALHTGGFSGSLRAVRAWGDHPGYVDLVAQRIEATRARLEQEWDGPVHLLFSAHGLPVRYVQRGDPYPEEVATTARLVAERVTGFADWRLSFQSRMGPVRWLQPSTDRMLRRLATENARALVVVPLGFVSDHIETLYDLDILYRDEARTLGFQHYSRVPSFNADPALARVLADVLDHLA